MELLGYSGGVIVVSTSINYVHTTEKPPLGIISKKLHDEQQFNDLNNAIKRHLRTNKPVPPEWFEEYNEFLSPDRKEMIKLKEIHRDVQHQAVDIILNFASEYETKMGVQIPNDFINTLESLIMNLKFKEPK